MKNYKFLLLAIVACVSFSCSQRKCIDGKIFKQLHHEVWVEDVYRRDLKCKVMEKGRERGR